MPHFRCCLYGIIYFTSFFLNHCTLYKRIQFHMSSTQHNPLHVLCICPIIVTAYQVEPHTHPHTDGIKTPKWLCWWWLQCQTTVCSSFQESKVKSLGTRSREYGRCLSISHFSPVVKPGQYDENEVLHCSEAKWHHIVATVLVLDRVQVMYNQAIV